MMPSIYEFYTTWNIKVMMSNRSTGRIGMQNRMKRVVLPLYINRLVRITLPWRKEHATMPRMMYDSTGLLSRLVMPKMTSVP